MSIDGPVRLVESAPAVEITIGAARATAGLATLAILVASIAWVDRPAATLVFSTFHSHRAWFDALTHLVDPVLPIASLGLLFAAAAGIGGYRPGSAARVAITCCLAVVLVVTLKEQAKYAFGRLWPETWVDNNPSWIGSGSYGFYPFHGGRGWASFPSGHTAVMSAPAAVLWRAIPRHRWFPALAFSLVAIGLFGADYHFLSDILAGALLGTACGRGAEALVSQHWSLGPGITREDARPAGASLTGVATGESAEGRG